MRYAFAFFCLIACCGSAWAQYGISNQRDMYGNLPRDRGASSQTGINQGPTNNGPIRSTPAPTTNNIGPINSTGQINSTNPAKPR
jgi:hypothetical protein